MSTSKGQLKLLSLDGGGIRGLSSIMILEHLVNRTNQVRKEQGLAPEEPWQMFDLIGGTSTGGIIAIMLGRLRMSVKDCRIAYGKMSARAFTPLHSKINVFASTVGLWNAEPTFDVTELEKAILEVIQENTKEAEVDPKKALFLEDDSDDCCKVFVVCTHYETTELATFRSYVHPTAVRTNILDECRIWEACRATSAAPTFFPPIQIEGQTFLDGGLTYNNPVQLVCEEAQALWRHDEPLLISIGTGDAPATEFGNNIKKVLKTLKNIAVETDKTANRFIKSEGRAMATDHRYYRFNVPTLAEIGLEEWEKTPRLRTLTETYLDNGETGYKTEACVEKLAKVFSTAEAISNRRKGEYFYNISLSVRPKQPVYELSVDHFSALNEHLDDPDSHFPGRKLWYREEITETGYPACVEVEPRYRHKKIRPIGKTILTCRRDVNLLVRGQDQYIMPGKYYVFWLMWFWGGHNCYASSEKPTGGYAPVHPQRNLVSERFFPSTIEGEEPPKLDSGFCWPWNFRFSAGRPQNNLEFPHTNINVREKPLHAPCLLMPGFEEVVVDYGDWNTLKNSGWCEVGGKTVVVGNDGHVGFVIGREWRQNWTGGLAFGGVKLVPVASQ